MTKAASVLTDRGGFVVVPAQTGGAASGGCYGDAQQDQGDPEGEDLQATTHDRVDADAGSASAG